MAIESPDYDALIAQARQGDYAPAKAYLEAHLDERQYLFDYLTIMGWAGQDDALIAAYEKYGRAQPLPDYALVQVAKAYRGLRQWSQALALYEEGRRRFPDDAAMAFGEVLVLADAQRFAQAYARGQAAVRQWPRNPHAHLALAYAYTQADKVFEALAHIDTAYGLEPAQLEVRTAYVQALLHARMPLVALRVASAQPGAVPPPLMRAIEGDVVAEVTRMAEQPTRSESERFDLADQALAMYDELLVRWRAQEPSPQADIVRLRIDRMAALHARMRMQELVQAYAQLLQEGVEVPVYALPSVASAYLYVRQPSQASALYTQILAAQSATLGRGGDERMSAQMGLYYASLETNAFDKATDLAKVLDAQQPIWRYPNGVTVRTPNPNKLETQRLSALHHAQLNDWRAAQTAVADLLAKAPNNTGLLTDQAHVQRVLDLPRAAEQSLRMAQTLDARAQSVEVGQGFTALMLQEWQQAELLHADMLARFPHELPVQQLDRQWKGHNKAQLEISGVRGLKSASALTGNHDKNMDATLYSAPMAYHWRALAGWGFASSRFDDGALHYRWARAGAQWRSRDVTAQADVTINRYGQGSKVGMGASIDYAIDDHWQVGADAQWRSRSAPLQALKQGISTNRLDLYAAWKADALTQWRLVLSPSDFSDGNRRIEALVQGQQRLWSQPLWWLDGLLDVSASHNSLSGTPYFNPRADAGLLPALQATHVLHRHYETVWEHYVVVGAGVYAQRHYGRAQVATWEYGQRFRTRDALEVSASLSGQSRPYDGLRENSAQFGFNLMYRF